MDRTKQGEEQGGNDQPGRDLTVPPLVSVNGLRERNYIQKTLKLLSSPPCGVFRHQYHLIIFQKNEGTGDVQ